MLERFPINRLESFISPTMLGRVVVLDIRGRGSMVDGFPVLARDRLSIDIQYDAVAGRRTTNRVQVLPFCLSNIMASL